MKLWHVTEDLKNYYCYRPHSIPVNIRSEAKKLIETLVHQGVIQECLPNETSEFSAPCSFVPKKSGSLCFIVDYTSLNKFIERLTHSFPTSDDIMRSIPAETTHIGIIDFVSGYFQTPLHPDSQGLTRFISEFGSFVFLRTPQGLSSRRVNFCKISDSFFSGLHEYLFKQVDDCVIYGQGEEDFLRKMCTAVREGLERNALFSIGKFTADHVGVTGGFKIECNPTGEQVLTSHQTLHRQKNWQI